MFILFLLVSFFCSASEIDYLSYPTLVLNEREVCDLRLVSNGSFSPLEGFMNEEDYNAVLNTSHLASGALFPLPIVLSISEGFYQKAEGYGYLLLKDVEGHPLALLEIQSLYRPDVDRECLSAFGTLDPNHPSVPLVLARRNSYYAGGKIHSLKYLEEMDALEGILSPEETKCLFKACYVKNVVAFQTRNPLHRAHVALIQRCLDEVGEESLLFLHPVVGPTQDQDIEAPARKKCYEALRPYLTKSPLHIGYLPLAMRMAGPKEALLHAIIRKNYGATHFIVGRDHAGPSSRDSSGKSFYKPYDAQNLLKSHEAELGIKIITSKEMVYLKESDLYLTEDELASDQTPEKISGTEVRKRFESNQPLPTWFSFPEVEEILSNYYSHRNGLCIYLTGLPSSGKSTLAKELKVRLEEIDPFCRKVTILDGDMIRHYLASELGFSKKDRSINVRRIGYVASLIVQSGGICIAANIAPYEEDRAANRALIQEKGKYFEIFVNTPLEICEQRDVKGLYQLAKNGIIKEFTGISDPYEIPLNPELEINTCNDLSSCIQNILDNLKISYLPLAKAT
jgi:sulfate adenylyltransferase